jgi:hypothetical protein
VTATPEYLRWWRDEPQHIRDFWDGKKVARTPPAQPIGVLLYDAVMTRLAEPGQRWRYRVDAIACQYRRQANPPGTKNIRDTPWEAIEAAERVFLKEMWGTRLVRARSFVFHDGDISVPGEVPGETMFLHATQ